MSFDGMRCGQRGVRRAVLLAVALLLLLDVSPLAACPSDVFGTKTVSGSFVPGGTITYTVTLLNLGDLQHDNPGDEFTDVLPAQLTLVNAVATSGTAVANVGTNTVTWNGSIPKAGGSVTITITATVKASTLGGAVVTNQGTIAYEQTPEPGNDGVRQTDDPGVGGASDPTSFTVLSPATVSGTKTVSGTFLPGSTVTYTVILANSAGTPQGDNPGNELTDVLPAQLTLVSAVATSGTAVATVGTNTVTWNGSIGPSGSVTITITATIKPATPGGTVVSNQGAIAFDADGNGTNESNAVTDNPGTPAPNDPTTFTVLSPAAVSGTKTVSGAFTPGGTVTYTVVLTNGGGVAQLDNPGNEFTDVLPAQLTLVSAVATSGTPVATVGTNTVTWNGSIGPGGSVTITITATIKPATPGGTMVSNQGAISFDADANGTNEASAATDNPGTPAPSDPTTFTVLSPAAVSGTKTVSGTFAIGGTVTYTVVLTNGGSSPQFDNPGAEFTDVLPAQLTLVSATATSGTAVATVGTNTVTWNGALAAGGSVTITIQATINAPSPGTSSPVTVVNQGTIHFDGNGNGTNGATALTTIASFDLVVPIPTLHGAVFAVLAAGLAATGFVVLRKRPRAA